MSEIWEREKLYEPENLVRWIAENRELAMKIITDKQVFVYRKKVKPQNSTFRFFSDLIRILTNLVSLTKCDNY